ncbi:MAG: class I SAM-dependent methyltransferase [Pseudomonadota bacterium]
MNDESPGTIKRDVAQVVLPIAEHFQGKTVTPEAVLWPNSNDLLSRFKALISPLDWRQYSKRRPLKLLDVGCGPAFLLDYLASNSLLEKVSYTGIDLVPEILTSAKTRWPDYDFEIRDIRSNPFPEHSFDYAVFCGVFTAKFGLDYAGMLSILKDTISSAWNSVDLGLGYNVMSKHVDWERDDLFHLPCDDAITLAIEQLNTRNVRILHDYGLYEYSCLLSKNPILSSQEIPSSWK